MIRVSLAFKMKAWRLFPHAVTISGIAAGVSINRYTSVNDKLCIANNTSKHTSLASLYAVIVPTVYAAAAKAVPKEEAEEAPGKPGKNSATPDKKANTPAGKDGKGGADKAAAGKDKAGAPADAKADVKADAKGAKGKGAAGGKVGDVAKTDATADKDGAKAPGKGGDAAAKPDANAKSDANAKPDAKPDGKAGAKTAPGKGGAAAVVASEPEEENLEVETEEKEKMEDAAPDTKGNETPDKKGKGKEKAKPKVIPNVIPKAADTISMREAPDVVSRLGIPSQDNMRVFDDFVLAYDRKMRTALWVFEHLTLDKVTLGEEVTREGVYFYPDENINAYFRGENDDYQKSGYDRGHLAAAGNHKWSQDAMKETFTLSNVAPQVGKGFNRTAWNKLEKFVRYLTRLHTNVYVLTGPLYLPKIEMDGKMYVKYEVIGKNQVAVPTHFFKVVVCENDVGDCEMMSYVMPNSVLPDNIDLNKFLCPVNSIERAAGFLIFDKIPLDKIKKMNGKEPEPQQQPNKPLEKPQGKPKEKPEKEKPEQPGKPGKQQDKAGKPQDKPGKKANN